LICPKHGDVGKPLSNGSCVHCERDKLGDVGLALIEVLLDNDAMGNKSMSMEDAINETVRRVSNQKAGMKK